MRVGRDPDPKVEELLQAAEFAAVSIENQIYLMHSTVASHDKALKRLRIAILQFEAPYNKNECDAV